MTDDLEKFRRAVNLRRIRIEIDTTLAERLREIAHENRRSPADQAAWMLENAIRHYEGRSEDDGER